VNRFDEVKLSLDLRLILLLLIVGLMIVLAAGCDKPVVRPVASHVVAQGTVLRFRQDTFNHDSANYFEVTLQGDNGAIWVVKTFEDTPPPVWVGLRAQFSYDTVVSYNYYTHFAVTRRLN
jgi:hypothetical protein